MISYTNDNALERRSISSGDVSPSITTDMKLFGLPYQFTESVDPRIKDVSNVVGYNYIEKIMMDAPTVIFIPGKAKFLPGVNNEEAREGLGQTLMKVASGESFTGLLSNLSTDIKEKVRYYDFEEDYAEYMRYVNILCRTVAGFLELDETFPVNGRHVSLKQYDWKHYRWGKEGYKSSVRADLGLLAASTINIVKNSVSTVSNIYRKRGNEVDLYSEDGAVSSYDYTNNFVQFYVDPSSSSNQNITNSTQASMIKSAMDTMAQSVKEFSFVAQSTGAGDMSDKVRNFTDDSMSALNEILGSSSGTFGTVINQIFSAGSAVIQGENIVLPEIYTGSDYGIDYTVDIHLRTPYGNKYSVFVDVIVPMLHLMALTLPRQHTANTYGSPFLIKAYFPGVFNCNLGIVESLQISRPSNDDAWTTDGLPTELTCQLRIKDLYSDMSMSPSNDPTLFVNNTNLIDYLATISGLNLVQPQLNTKFEMLVSSYVTAFTDIDDNVKSFVLDGMERHISSFLKL